MRTDADRSRAKRARAKRRAGSASEAELAWLERYEADTAPRRGGRRRHATRRPDTAPRATPPRDDTPPAPPREPEPARDVAPEPERAETGGDDWRPEPVYDTATGGDTGGGDDTGHDTRHAGGDEADPEAEPDEGCPRHDRREACSCCGKRYKAYGRTWAERYYRAGKEAESVLRLSVVRYRVARGTPMDVASKTPPLDDDTVMQLGEAYWPIAARMGGGGGLLGDLAGLAVMGTMVGTAYVSAIDEADRRAGYRTSSAGDGPDGRDAANAAEHRSAEEREDVQEQRPRGVAAFFRRSA